MCSEKLARLSAMCSSSPCCYKLRLIPWPRVFSGCLGKFPYACLFMIVILLVSMIIGVSNFIRMVSTHPNIICPPISVQQWLPKVGCSWAAFVVFMAKIFRDLSYRKKKKIITISFLLPILVGSFYVMFIPYIDFSLMKQDGTLIKSDNGTDMYQYRRGGAYPVLPAQDENTPKIPGCHFFKIDQICPWLPYMPSLPNNTPGVIRCESNSEEGLKLFSTYMNPLSIEARSSMNFGIATSSFITFTVSFIISRRLGCFCGCEPPELAETAPLLI